MLIALAAAATISFTVPVPQDSPAPSVASGEHWPGFRGLGASHTAATGLPTTWSDEAGVAWTAALQGTGQSSPVVFGGRAFVTSVAGARKERCIVACYRVEDGALLWLRSFAATLEIELSEMVSRGAPTPWVDADGLFAFFESGDVFALDHDGEVLWTRALAAEFGPFEGNHGVGSSPVATATALCLLVDHAGPSYLVGLAKSDGKLAWRTERESRVSWTSPVLLERRGRTELVTSSNGFVEGYDPAAGELLWKVSGVEGNTVPSPTAWGDHVLVGASKGAGCVLIDLSADAEAGKVRWVAEGARPSGFGSPVVAGGLALLVNKSGTLFGITLADGGVAFEERLAEGCWASPLLAGDLVYSFGKGGVTTVLRLGTDGVELVAENRLSPVGGVVGVAAVDGRLLLREEERLVCISRPALVGSAGD